MKICWVCVPLAGPITIEEEQPAQVIRSNTSEVLRLSCVFLCLDERDVFWPGL